MASERDVRSEQIQAILEEWRESKRTLYATVFDTSGMQSCAGQVASIDREVAVIADSLSDLRIPYASADDCAIAALDHRTKSITLTWRNGMSAFIVTRNEREDHQS